MNEVKKKKKTNERKELDSVSNTQGQDTQSYNIMAQRDREGVLSEEAASTTIRTVTDY